ncbi:MAG: hypothetical protein M1829_003881 [Trizodia sp. TS-e1964]|nr:MAG: hypothetical protein M1829_003881 [Trizodia sp. TS-e1964]
MDSTSLSTKDRSTSSGWRSFAAFLGPRPRPENSFEDEPEKLSGPKKWSMGILNDKKSDNVPGTVVLLSASKPADCTDSDSILAEASLSGESAKKRTSDGQIILEPQPDNSPNDPLNWPSLRRDTALLSLGFYCMVGGGMTPVLAAGFGDVATTYNVTIPQVALTTGLYIMGLGVGSVIASPTAILFGKRPVYLAGTLMFMFCSIWCAASPNYNSLVLARILMGISVSPVECLPSATIAEIFFLHERAYRVGIYTLLLLGGKNLVPLVSAAIIQTLGWRWVFWIVSMIVGLCFLLLFLLVPETFWDRMVAPAPSTAAPEGSTFDFPPATNINSETGSLDHTVSGQVQGQIKSRSHSQQGSDTPFLQSDSKCSNDTQMPHAEKNGASGTSADANGVLPSDSSSYYRRHSLSTVDEADVVRSGNQQLGNNDLKEEADAYNNRQRQYSTAGLEALGTKNTETYTKFFQSQPARTFVGSLKVWNGRLSQDNWLRVAIRPFILFSYPSILWSTLVYSLSVGWLIVLSETVASVYRQNPYHLSALSTGLIYLSPFIGGILGTAVAGKVSDIIVRFMSRRNAGCYEPEYRLVMIIPVAICTSIGLMGFGWSAEVHDGWIVPTIFFGVISFGCSLGSTTAITFCVDSYREYAGEALVTMNFSKNIFHGLVFSLFVNRWLEADGLKTVYLALGGIHLACLLLTIPMYIFGKRARMWTSRQKLMEKF